MKQPQNLAAPVLACLFAALISVGAYIAVPLPGTPVPIVLQNMFIMLAALVLGPKWGLVSTVVYLALGAAGLPVFSGGTGGFARFIGPTGGYLVGYIPAVLAMGSVSGTGKPNLVKNAIAVIAGMLIVYGCGVVWLRQAINGTWIKALAAGFFPFIPGDLIKMTLVSVLALRLRPIADRATGKSVPETTTDPDSGNA